MDRKIFDDGIEELITAFSGLEMTEVRAEIWYKYSKHLTDGQWLEKIASCIKRCNKNVPVLADILDTKGYYYESYKPIQPRKI